MRILQLLLMVCFIAVFPNAAFAQNQAHYSKVIQGHADLFDLSVRQYLFATQQLSKGQFRPTVVTSPLEHQILADGFSKTFLRSNRELPDLPTKAEKEAKNWKAEQFMTQKHNEIVVKHANYLNISVLDLKAFYSHRNTEPFRNLLSSQAMVPDNSEPVNVVVVEVSCSQSNCNTEWLKTDTNHVAGIWEASVPHVLPDMQKFVVRFVNGSGEQIGLQEYWRFYEKLGPRFISSFP